MIEETLQKKIVDECHRIEEDAEHSSKSHYNAAEFWSNVNLILGLPSAGFAAFAGGVSATNGPDLTVSGAAFFSTLLITCLTFLKPGEKSDTHKNAGNSYLILRNKTRLFREIHLLSEVSPEELKRGISQLADRRDELNSTMPIFSRKDYEKAKKDIDEGRSKYYIDSEER